MAHCDNCDNFFYPEICESCVKGSNFKDVEEDWNHTINQSGIISIYRRSYPTTKYTFFLSTHRTFSKTDHILGHKQI